MKVDIREIYLKRLLSLDRSTHASFQQAFGLIVLFLEDKKKRRDDELTDVEKAYDALEVFTSRFANENGIPPLQYILWELDKMRWSGKEILRVKSKYRRKKFQYQEILLWLNDLEDYLLELVREKALTIRITNPEISLV